MASSLRRSTSSVSFERKAKGSLIWTFLMIGLVFCWIDSWYIFVYIQQTVNNNNNNVDTTATTNIMETTVVDTTTATKRSSSRNAPHHDKKKTDDRQPILDLLVDAGIQIEQLDPELVEQLPTWTEVTSLYGTAPHLVGLETCQVFRDSNGDDPADHLVGAAGTFNTGTNLLAELLIKNCKMTRRMERYGKQQRGIRWQVPWGKHTPVDDEDFRQRHRAQKDEGFTANQVFPAVTIRDPASWMASMCRHSYSMNWSHNSATHCPNLIANQVDVEQDASLTIDKAVPVKIRYSDFTRLHDSMIHHWNEWYNHYLNADWPRLLVRYEDLLFFPKQTVTQVCECAGGQMNDKFGYLVESAKRGAVHGAQRTGYMDAIIKYGHQEDRWNNMTSADLVFARQTLDANLMKLFAYHYPSEPTTT